MGINQTKQINHFSNKTLDYKFPNHKHSSYMIRLIARRRLWNGPNPCKLCCIEKKLEMNRFMGGSISGKKIKNVKKSNFLRKIKKFKTKTKK